MEINLIKKFKQESKELGIPVWRLPDFLLIIGAFLNICLMILTYLWASKIAKDPREAVFFVAASSVLMLLISNVVVESSKKVIAGNRLKKEFIDIISHQIRSPLTNIKWSLESLQNSDLKCLNDRQKEKIYDAIKSSEKTISLLGDFIYLSKIENEKEQGAMSRVDVVKMIRKTLVKFESFSISKNVKINFNPGNKKCFIETDAGRLEIVINNLIDNALKYSNENSEIFLELEKKNGKSGILFKVTNYGPGIDKSDKDNIFVKFFRGENGRRMVSSGTGLGLYICKKLLGEINGKIWFESTLNEKTVFYIEIK